MVKLVNRDQILSKLNGFIDSNFGTPAPEKFKLIEVGSLQSYNRNHLLNSIYLSLEQIQRGASPWLPDLSAQIIVYSSPEAPQAGKLAAEALSKQGYSQVFFYPSGKEDWVTADLWATQPGLEMKYRKQ